MCSMCEHKHLQRCGMRACMWGMHGVACADDGHGRSGTQPVCAACLVQTRSRNCPATRQRHGHMIMNKWTATRCHSSCANRYVARAAPLLVAARDRRLCKSQTCIQRRLVALPACCLAACLHGSGTTLGVRQAAGRAGAHDMDSHTARILRWTLMLCA